MKPLRHLLLISFIAIFAVLAIMPGCDELTTEENFYYDTIRIELDSVFVYYDTTIYDSIIYVDTIIIADSSCFNCHLQYENEIDLADYQWVNSRHASLDLIDDAAACGSQCHSQEAFIASVSGDDPPSASYLPIDCKSCHNPHETQTFDMRVDDFVAVNLITGDDYDLNSSNICATCHQSTETITDLIDNNYTDDTLWTQSADWADWENHGSSQANHFISVGGYERIDIDPSTSHATVTNGCIGCHYNASQGLSLGGHSFNISNGIEYSFASCNIAGCHESTPMTLDSLNNLQAFHNSKLTELGTLLYLANLADSTTDNITAKTSLLDINGLDTNMVRAMYNYFFIANDKSGGLHNWDYDSTLLSQSIFYVDSVLNPPPVF